MYVVGVFHTKEYFFRNDLIQLCSVLLKGGFISDFFFEFLRGYREYFEKVERDYKERVKIFQGYLDFEQSIKII